ncbi:hypothetical protein [Sulfuricella sp.]|uniref:hypothetical protein n=1 Tax=Sulfuricella sp. TaxID=2099377 RepID=UPI002B5BF9B1|nr:hypothetical protein [Sulfuricella sp.]HUX63677.1 hypothetical protein [Sulfuricella sp.]
MKIVIDAWLERKDPQIRFLDGDNASVLMQVGPALTRQLLGHGEISVEDLQNPLNHDLASLVFRMLGIPVANEVF